MCSSPKRSSYEADDSSDDDFDYSLQKRLRTDRPNRKHQREKSENSKRPRKKRTESNSVKSNGSVSSSITHSIESPTSATLDYIALVESNDDSITDNNLSSSHIITDLLDDCDDVLSVVEPQAITNTSQSPIKRSIDVPSPKKQSSLLDFFKVERNSVVLTKETSTSIKNNSTSSDGTKFKMYQSCNSQMVFKKSDEPKSGSSFYNKTNRDCPFYKKIPGTYVSYRIYHCNIICCRHNHNCGCIPVWEYSWM